MNERSVMPFDSSADKQMNPLLAGFLGALLAIVLTAGIVAAVVSERGGSIRTLLSASTGTESVSGTVSGAAGTNSDIPSVVTRVNPAVVSIVATKDVPVMEQYYQNFGQGFSFPRYRQNGTEEREVSSGSGFVISDDGYLVTNQHVVDDPDASYTVFFVDGTEYEATVVALGDVYDVALLKIEAGMPLPFLEFGDSDALQQGQTAIAIGNALGEFSNTVSVGVVSGLARNLVASGGAAGAEVLQNVIQTDAAINSGNSGGPLLDTNGYVIGVNVAVSSAGQSIGFALPANQVAKAVDDMRQFGRIVRPFLGVRYVTITDDVVRQNNLPVDDGALVLRGDNGELAVVPGSPADKAGIEENDIILKVNDMDVTEQKPLNILLQDLSPGDTVTLDILHDGEEKAVSAVLVEPPTDTP